MARPLIASIARAGRRWRDPEYEPRRDAVAATLELENRFTEEALAFAINQQMSELEERALSEWLPTREPAASDRTVGVIHPGNVPLAGLQDLIAVLGCGHGYLGRASRRASILLPRWLREVAVEYAERAEEELPARTTDELDELFAEADTLLATGSDETAATVRRRCEETGIPADRRLIRGHSYGVAVVDGGETEEEREGLAEDAFLHEGRGCRNVALIFAPAGLDPDPYFDAFGHFRHVYPPHPETEGALEMPRALLEAVDAPRAWGPGLLVSRGEPEVQGPAHVRWVPYEEPGEVSEEIRGRGRRVQLVVARGDLADRLDLEVPIVRPGTAQRPPLGWCPDGVDTLGWLQSLAGP